MHIFRRYKQTQNQSLRKWLNKRTFLLLGILLLVLLLCFLAFRLIFGKKRVPPQKTAFFTQSEIVVGIVAPTAFATIENDAINGFEKDVATAIISYVYPDSTLNFVSIPSQEASYLLKTGEIDVALGLYTKGVLKTQGLSYTEGYFIDGLYLYTLPTSTASSIQQFHKKTICVMTSEIEQKTITQALEPLDLEMTLRPCSSYLDGIESMETGHSSGLITTKYKALPYIAALRQLETPIASVPYRMFLWRDNKDAAALFDEAIVALRKDGTIPSLIEKWNLEECQVPEKS